MRFSEIFRFSKLFIIGLFLPQFVILGIYLRKLYFKFLTFCPNQNFLTWDPDARLVTSIRFAEAFRSFDLWTVVRLTFDSPTWPVLRNFPEALIVSLFGPGGTPVSLFTFAELILLFCVVPWILFRFTQRRSWIAAGILFPIVCGGLLQNPGWMHYTFSGMLEIQGGLFYLPSILALWEMQKHFSSEKDSNEEKNLDPNGTKADNADSYSPWFLFFSVNLLFHTKYPYGYIFIFFGCLFLSFFRFTETKELTFKILDSYRKSIKKATPVLIGFSAILVSVILSKEILPGKTKGLLRYAGVLIVWISVSRSLWKEFYPSFKNEKAEPFFHKEISPVWKNFWTYCILPVGSWVLFHPDRFSSSSSTIGHAQGAGLLPGQSDGSVFTLTYFQEILENSFYAPNGGALLLFCLFLGLCFGVIDFKKEKKISASFFLILSIFISILGLTLMTPNHQPRHIYHLYPAMFVSIGIFCYEWFISKKYRIFTAIVYSIILMFTAGYTLGNQFAVWEKTNLCFSGVDRSLFYTADDAEEVFKKNLNRPSVFWNRLPLEHHNRPDLTLSFYRAGLINRQEAREKQKKEGFYSEKNLLEKPDWFIAAKSCEEIEGNLWSSPVESKFSKEVEQFPIRGACIVKVKGIP
ncbi:hypothetical protein [Leptospira adleri]|uniref:Dolichyl-phosphate-mannose--protein mannosyltransferase n=1 Tax=Leptospira adleri TaxID=2023186 RepID=A0A2M9YS85_9LEPT|nr:hypothetical protein [Leptospira adleri]PJZ54397.1 hypothetical protein CH380_04820 [Leptospira adleri]PJZ62792.1 hypothetical protein CH376_06495 [Leptospira adleri]